MTKQIERKYFAGPRLNLTEISEFLERRKVQQYVKEHQIKIPNLAKPEVYLEGIVDDFVKKGLLDLKERLRQISPNKSEVFDILDDYGSMPRVLIVKKYEDITQLKKQLLRDRFIYMQLKDLPPYLNFVPFSRPICFKKIVGEFYYVIRRVKGKNLDEKLQNGASSKDIEAIEKILEHFADFHATSRYFAGGEYEISEEINGELISDSIGKFNYLENMLERAVVGKNHPQTLESLEGTVNESIGIKLKNWIKRRIKKDLSPKKEYKLSEKYERLGYNDKLLPFLREYKKFIDKKLSILPFEAILHCDAYPTNVLEGGTIIDPKPLKRGNPMLDISHFLISPKFDFINQQGSITTENLLDSYFNHLSEQLNLDSATRKELRETYNPHVAHNSICLIGAMLDQSKKDPKKKKDARYFFNKAVDIMEELKLDNLKNLFIDYVKNSEYAKENGLLMKIGIDFDGVISDSTRLKINMAKKMYNIDLQPEHCSKNNAEEAGLPKEDYEKMVREIYGTDFFLSAEEIPEVKETIERLVERGNEVYIITSRSEKEVKIAEKWLANRGIPYTELVKTNEQSKLPVCKEKGIDVFIDDTYEKLEELTGNRLSLYLFSSPANRNIEIKHQDIKIAKDWKKLSNFL